MTKQEEVAVQMKRVELQSKIVAADAAIEQAEKERDSAEDQHARTVAQYDLNLAQSVKRAAVEALIEHDEQQRPVHTEIGCGSEGEQLSPRQIENRLETFKVQQERIKLEMTLFRLDEHLKVLAMEANRILELDKLDGLIKAAKATRDDNVGKGA
jgi:hypothetical protein